jgi:rhodanese-related sulfurtransferase
MMSDAEFEGFLDKQPYKPGPPPPFISAAEVAALVRDGGCVLVDARSAKEQKVSMIPGAVTADEIRAALAGLGGRKLIVYCTVGVRSGDMARKLRNDGIDAYNLRGGVLAWARAQEAFACQGKPTKSVHVFGSAWNVLPAGYTPVME